MTYTLNPFTAADADAMLALFDAHDDELDIADRFPIILLLALRITESAAPATRTDDPAIDFLLSHEICPLHKCDIQICADDDDPDCTEYRD